MRPLFANSGSVSATSGLAAIGAVAHQFVLLAGWATVLAILMSTQFLAQPFIWRSFELDAILPAWRDILRDRLVVALCIAIGLAVANALGPRDFGRRLIAQTLAIVGGAAAGELALRMLGSQDYALGTVATIGRLVRWTIVGGAIATMIYFWRSGSELAAAAEEARIEDIRLRDAAALSKLEMLKRQIEPHFLFNTMATIRHLQGTDPARSQHLLGRLLDFMSGTLGDRDNGVSTLAREIELVLAYLDVCAARMSGRLRVCCKVPADLAAIEMPTLILATLAENAIKHGIFPHDGGDIVIEARSCDAGMVEVTIADDGVGFGETVGGSGIGLANIGQRLRLLYGPGATLKLEANQPRGIRAAVLVPARSSR